MPPDVAPAANADEYANFIPEAIRRQSQRADDIAREAGVANVPEADPPVVGADTPPAVVPPAADPPAVTPPAPAVPPVPDEWAQRYRTLQGKYDAEIPSLRTQVTSLERVIAAIQPPAHVAPPAHPPTVVEVPAADREAFGDDLVAAAQRWARAELQPTIDQLTNTVKDLEAKYGTVEVSQRQTVTHTARQVVITALDSDPTFGVRVDYVDPADGQTKPTPAWRVTNNSPAFVAWLEQADPMSGQQRLQLLRSAFDAGQTPRVAAFLRAYAQEQTGSQAPPPAAAHTPPGAGAPRLEDLAAPGRGSGPVQPGAQAEKRIWTSQTIAAFYRDVQKGVYGPGREAEKLRLEQDIFAAAGEGRVR